jgi:DDE_Tnp_1-associated
VSASSSSPSPLVAALTGAELPTGGLSARQSITLLQELMAVPDPRHRRGRRHSLQSILLVALCAVLAGARSYAAIGHWAAIHRPALGVCGRPPHGATIRRVLMAVDPAAVERALTRWALTRRDAAAAADGQALAPRNQRRWVYAVDGKNLRGAQQPDGQQTQLVSVVDHTHRLILTQTEVVGGKRDRRLRHRPGAAA